MSFRLAQTKLLPSVGRYKMEQINTNEIQRISQFAVYQDKVLYAWVQRNNQNQTVPCSSDQPFKSLQWQKLRNEHLFFNYRLMPGFDPKHHPYILTTDSDEGKLLLVNIATKAAYELASLGQTYNDLNLYDRILLETVQFTHSADQELTVHFVLQMFDLDLDYRYYGKLIVTDSDLAAFKAYDQAYAKHHV